MPWNDCSILLLLVVIVYPVGNRQIYPGTTSRVALPSQTANSPLGNLDAVVGENVYAVGFSRVYERDATVKEMEQSFALKQYLTGWEAMDEFCRTRLCRSRRIPLLAPLRVTSVEYLSPCRAVLIKLRLVNGSEALSLTTAEMLEKAQKTGDLLSQISGSLLPKIPEGLSSREILAIKNREPFTGMRKNAIYDMFGFPIVEKELNGTTQMIYSGSLVVYVDKKGEMSGLRTPGSAASGLVH